MPRPAVALFGSARVAQGSKPYEDARAVGRRFGEQGWTVITGGGGGVMEGANRGAQEGGGVSVGFNIELPHEQHPNPYLDIVHTFNHFYARKVCFVRPSEGFVDLPRRLRHARRDVRVADADPDRQDPPLPGRALRLRLLGRDGRLDPRRAARRRDDLPGRPRAPPHDRRPRRGRAARARMLRAALRRRPVGTATSKTPSRCVRSRATTASSGERCTGPAVSCQGRRRSSGCPGCSAT